MAAAPEKRVAEEIVARVNNEIVTLSDLRRAREQVMIEIEEECKSGCSPEQKQSKLADRDKNLLRDLVDQKLLIQRAKDKGINVETDVVRRLDDIRQRNNFPTMEDLQSAVEKQGLNWEEFKGSIRDGILTQQVVRDEVGRTIITQDKAEIQKYYDEHKSEFERPEMVCLTEIFVSTVNKEEAEIPTLEARAKKLRERVQTGEDFYELAKRYSDGDTAKQSGDLGCFKRGELSKEIEEVVYKLKPRDLTEIIRTKTGFLLLKVEQRYEAGIQPLEKVESEIGQKIYYEKLQPKMREYLVRLREESYIIIKPGYTDTAAVSSTPIVEVESKGEDENGKKKKKKKKDSE